MSKGLIVKKKKCNPYGLVEIKKDVFVFKKDDILLIYKYCYGVFSRVIRIYMKRVDDLTAPARFIGVSSLGNSAGMGDIHPGKVHLLRYIGNLIEYNLKYARRVIEAA